VKVTVVVSQLCEVSLQTARLVREFCQREGIEYEEVSVRTMEGQRLALSVGVKILPAILIDGKLVHQGPVDEEALRQIVEAHKG